ncbi:hypothetical protein LX77_01432 [Gelidibacter algens]|uniref:DoxX-like protein n=1 Tax=Gelidibacter algens TaxID=49280 RepID=A0A327S871_9FLAO|nr:DUF6326 family protein [Gelidibacter algens]RAJ25131.1 hypothetical protein LX77_01432 [Gelidibacter algens]
MKSVNTNSLMNFEINTKLKLAFLWTAVTFMYIYGDYFELYIPQKVEGLITGNNLLDSPIKLFFASFLLAIPALMIVVSILLKPIINKWLNIIIGLFFTGIMLLIALSSFNPWRYFYTFYAIIESILTIVIVWNAFKWPKQQ